MSEETYRIFKVIFMFMILSLISCDKDMYDNMKEDGYQDLGDWDEFNKKSGF